MKKSKWPVYFLLLAAISIWGIIIYRIYKSVKPTNVALAYSLVYSSDSITNQSDTFSLKLGYKDPFLKNSIHHFPTNTSSAIKPLTTVKKEVKKVETISSFPNFSFLGAVKNQKSNVSFAYVQLNGESKTMKPGEVFNGIELKKIYKDSIEVKYQDKRKIITK